MSSVTPLASSVPLLGIINSTLNVIGATSSVINSTLDIIGTTFSIIDSTLDVIGTISDIIGTLYFPALCFVVLGRPDLPRLAISNTLVRIVPVTPW
jgi:Asp/Glu/hydantoin racemase